jgi:hypothetical protein
MALFHSIGRAYPQPDCQTPLDSTPGIRGGHDECQFLIFPNGAASEKDRLLSYCEGIGRILRQSLIYSTARPAL